MYLLTYKATQEKLGSGKDITRVCGAMMRPVHFNDKWQPISNEDMAAHEWNMRYLANLHTLYNGPILEGQERDALAEAEKKLADGKYTEERFKETKIVKSIEAKKENAEKELKKMAEEELIKTFSGGYEELPSPELLKKELLEPALKGEVQTCEIGRIEYRRTKGLFNKAEQHRIVFIRASLRFCCVAYGRLILGKLCIF